MPVGVLPSAPEAEASLLGTMMVYPNAARTGMEEGLSEDDFFVDVNRRIFTAVSSLYHEGSPVDLTTVSTRLKDMGQLELVGGFAYLTSLTDAAVTSHNTKHYVAMIHDKALLRKLIETAQTIVEEGTSGQADINEYLDQSEKAILNVSRSRRVSEFKGSPELMTSVLDQIQKMSDNHSDITGLKTGFRDLDHVTHGLQRGDLIILAARPSMGKTAVALNLALNVALYQPKQAVAIFSLEMAAEQLAMRLLSARSRVAGDKLKTGYLTNEEWNRVNEAAGELKMLKLYVDDTPGVKTSDIFSKCRRLQAEQGLSLVLIDYIQLITGNSGGRGEVNRQQEVSEISRNLKALARELGIPVIALSQLSRTVEQRENKHPQLSDLRESGAIEQDADIVMMLYRESYYNQEMKDNLDPDASEPLEINIAKHRNGATRRINVAFEASTNALMNIELTKEP
ncbi:MAG: replicative DNA helicase [Solobacterium sp.]|jgi:replicative DNA helicase|nr:replicative DNA helicase [Solobacterium sp.]MBR3342950.1 replicative DNA helicase [Solobacterium sp.]